jgi:hypothetical protein
MNFKRSPGCIAAIFVFLLSCLTSTFNLNAQNTRVKDLMKQQPNAGFFENKGQVMDQNGSNRPDVKFIYDNHGFKLILKEIFRWTISAWAKQLFLNRAIAMQRTGSGTSAMVLQP